MSLGAPYDRAARLIADHRDVLDARAPDGDPPDALVARGWVGPLLALSDDALAGIEIGGADAPVPDALGALAAEARAVSTLQQIADVDGALRPRFAVAVGERGVKARKRAQVEAFAAIVAPLAERAQRVVDAGSGHGHATRAIAALVPCPVVGLERDPRLVERARAIVRAEARDDVVFAAVDALAVHDSIGDASHASARAGDCVIGLHACGELGDAMVARVARDDGAASLVLVGCCPQKRRGDARVPMSARGGVDDAASAQVKALALPKRVLGLANAAPGDDGVEASRSDNLAARERRLALRKLLQDATGVALDPGEEIAGLNRRAAQRDLASLVERAFAARGLASPSAPKLDDAQRWANVAHARARRLAIPRLLLARALEVFIALDRGVLLEQRGFTVRVGVAFEQTVSARNIAIAAWR